MIANDVDKDHTNFTNYFFITTFDVRSKTGRGLVKLV